MKSPVGTGQQGHHGMIPGSPGCRSNISQASPGSGALEVAPRSRWDVSKHVNITKLKIHYLRDQFNTVNKS